LPESRAVISCGTSLSEAFASTPLYRKHLLALYISASEFRLKLVVHRAQQLTGCRFEAYLRSQVFKVASMFNYQRLNSPLLRPISSRLADRCGGRPNIGLTERLMGSNRPAAVHTSRAFRAIVRVNDDRAHALPRQALGRQHRRHWRTCSITQALEKAQ